MTDDALTRLLAEKVMGWTITHTPELAGKFILAKCPQIYAPAECDWCQVLGANGQPWRPLERIDHAWQIVGRASEWSPAQRTRFTFELECLGRETVSQDIDATWPSALFVITPRAICLAALRAVGQDVEEG
ncbi:MAG TPA: hypothetical protein VLT87_11290 [Thermoanaerobaculia bacterium]|nr:hypothetical protein [Thermoanaerobaculia bacterium]